MVHLQIERMEPGLEIAPLLLVVLIENAFKFVSNFSDRENKICIHLTVKEGILLCTISNTKEVQPVNSTKKTNGIGIANLKRRLELLYPGHYAFTIKNENEFYETNLTIHLS